MKKIIDYTFWNTSVFACNLSFAKLPSPIYIWKQSAPLSPSSLLKAARALCPKNVPVFPNLLVNMSPLSLPAGLR